MRRFSSTVILFVLLLLLAPANSAAAGPVSQPKGWALGFMLGEPTGLSAKYWLGGANAIDLGVGAGPGLRLHADYLFGLTRLAREPSFNLDLYVGVGGVVGSANGYCGVYHGDRFCDGGAFAGARVPLGIDFIFRNAPIELGLEIAPGLWVGRPFFAGLLDAFIYLRFLL